MLKEGQFLGFYFEVCAHLPTIISINFDQKCITAVSNNHIIEQTTEGFDPFIDPHIWKSVDSTFDKF